MSDETFVEKQVRLVLERQCRDLAADLKAKVPAGVGFALFLFDFGAKGNSSYVSTADREDMIRLLEDWLDRQGTTRTPVTARVQAVTLRGVADALEEVASRIGSPQANAEQSVLNIVDHLRRDAAALDQGTPTTYESEPDDEVV